MFKKPTTPTSSPKNDEATMERVNIPASPLIGPFARGNAGSLLRKPVKPKMPTSPLSGPTTNLRRGAGLVTHFHRPDLSSTPRADGKKLVVGKSIKLSGDIDVCESLIVEGNIEANLADARVLDIMSEGVFKGAAEVDEAHISGTFDGTLTVRRIAVFYPTANIKGKIRYEHELIVEPGAVIKADIKYVGDRKE